ncbi:MAG: hypothetical protein ACXVPQ_10225 [Bacteroidia bacterium]
MKKLIIIMVSTIVALLAVIMYRSSKSPAAEDRVKMDQVAKHVSDSIHVNLDSALNDPIKEMGGSLPSSQLQAPPPAAQPAAATSTAAAHK